MVLTKRKLALVGIGIVILLVVVSLPLLFSRSRHHKQGSNTDTMTGTVKLVLHPAAITNVTATLNNKPITLNTTTTNYTLKAGTYTLVVTKTGYNSFSQQFILGANHSLVININLRIDAPTPTSTPSNTAPAAQTPIGTTIQDRQIIDTVYFANSTWAFVNTTRSDGAIAFFIIQYDGASQTWNTAFGPGTIFPQSNLSILPTDMQAYLQNNGYTYNDGGN